MPILSKQLSLLQAEKHYSCIPAEHTFNWKHRTWVLQWVLIQEYWQAAPGVGAGVKQLPMGQADFKGKSAH